MQSANDSYTFTFGGKPIRMLLVNGELWMCGKDIANVLEYKDSNKAITKNVDTDDRRKYVALLGVDRESTPVNSLEQPHTVYINESGFYSLVLRSKLPTAKQFKKWVTSEVLPSIRRNGYYVDPSISDEKIEQLRIELENTKLKLATLEKRNVALSSFVDNAQLLERTQVFYIATSRSLASQNRFKYGGVNSVNLLSSRIATYNSSHPADDPFYICKYYMCNSYKLIENHIRTLLIIFRDKLTSSTKEMLHLRYDLLCNVIDMIVENSDREIEYINGLCRQMLESTVQDEPIVPNPVEFKDNVSITVTRKQVRKSYSIDISDWSDDRVNSFISDLMDSVDTNRSLNWAIDLADKVDHGPLNLLKKKVKEYAGRHGIAIRWLKPK